MRKYIKFKILEAEIARLEELVDRVELNKVEAVEQDELFVRKLKGLMDEHGADWYTVFDILNKVDVEQGGDPSERISPHSIMQRYSKEKALISKYQPIYESMLLDEELIHEMSIVEALTAVMGRFDCDAEAIRDLLTFDGSKHPNSFERIYINPHNVEIAMGNKTPVIVRAWRVKYGYDAVESWRTK